MIYDEGWGEAKAIESCTVWADQDFVTVTCAAHAVDYLDELSRAIWPNGGRAVTLQVGQWPDLENAPLRISMDYDAGRAAVRWVPDGGWGVEPNVAPHHEDLHVLVDSHEPVETIAACKARVTPGGVRRAMWEYATTGQRPSSLEWRAELDV
ncbi:Imm1 family immunity protein [Krasilnikovia sp. MM14-A1259]|uniref:Imm1 family immunity protein n=1 Tax=Krasilnikovia sp. MM14-A1259 TaxID=3373539 RepID=UPI0037FF7794